MQYTRTMDVGLLRKRWNDVLFHCAKLFVNGDLFDFSCAIFSIWHICSNSFALKAFLVFYSTFICQALRSQPRSLFLYFCYGDRLAIGLIIFYFGFASCFSRKMWWWIISVFLKTSKNGGTETGTAPVWRVGNQCQNGNMQGI